MAGQIVVSTISDGTNSTSSTNCIQGSAKAWVNFNGTGTVAIRASYNVGSITKNGTADYTVNFTTAMSDANYALTFGMSPQNGRFMTNWNGTVNNGTTAITNTTSSARVASFDGAAAVVNTDATNAYVAVFR